MKIVCLWGNWLKDDIIFNIILWNIGKKNSFKAVR